MDESPLHCLAKVFFAEVLANGDLRGRLTAIEPDTSDDPWNSEKKERFLHIANLGLGECGTIALHQIDEFVRLLTKLAERAGEGDGEGESFDGGYFARILAIMYHGGGGH